MSTVPPTAVQSVEQQRYARWLETGARIGLAVLVVSFIAYGAGLLQATVPPQRLPALWSLPVAAYLQQTQTPVGWGWLWHLRQGDMTPLLGIAVLAGCSMSCLLAVVPQYARRGDQAFVALCLAEVAVIVLAASGWLTGGHA